MRPHPRTYGRTLNHAAACCNIRLHAITLSEGPVQPPYETDTSASDSFMKHEFLVSLLVYITNYF